MMVIVVIVSYAMLLLLITVLKTTYEYLLDFMGNADGKK